MGSLGRALVLLVCAAASTSAQQTHERRIAIKVIDGGFGTAIADAIVEVVGVGTRITDSTGLALFDVLLQDSAVAIARKLGYSQRTLTFSPRASGDVTIRLDPVTLPSVTVREDGVAPDLLHKLRTVGFIERRTSSAAPSSSFITDADLKRWKPQLVSDITARLGKSVSNCTAYVDGVAVNVAGRAMGMRQGIDVLFLPSDLAAVEVYVRSSVTPSQFPARGRSNCVVLYWLR